MRALTIGVVLLALSACATPITKLTNPQTGEVQTCGGGTAGSILGGLAGYKIEQSHDRGCVADLKARGFVPVN